VTVAFDATFGSAALINTATTTTWTHTPVGTPKGVVVLIPQGTATDNVTAVTYGGVALNRVRFAARGSAEACAVYIYFLGAGIPTGAQTVAVTTAGTPPCWPQSVTMTATGAKTAIEREDGADAGIVANPQFTIVPVPAGTCACYVNASGLNTPVDTPQAGTTRCSFRDLGTISGHTGRKDLASAGSTTIGWTSAIDDVAHAVIVVSEYDPARLVMGRYG